MTAKHISIITVCVTMLAGCSSHRTDPAAKPAHPVAITSQNLDQILGMQWTLKAMVINGNEYPLSEQMPFIKFEDNGRLSGFASVNRIFGAIQIDHNGAVKWSAPLGSTRMAGPPERMNQESTFLSILKQTKSLTLRDMSLHTQTPNPETKLVFLGSVN